MVVSMALPPGIRVLALALVLLALPACAGGDQKSAFCEAVDEYSKIALGPGGTRNHLDEAISALDGLVKHALSDEDRATFEKWRASFVYQRDKNNGKEDLGEPPPQAQMGEITKALGGRCAVDPATVQSNR